MTRVIARQHSPLRSTEFRLTAGGVEIGALVWPMIAQAENARLRWHEKSSDGSPRLHLGASTFEIVTEYLERGFNNSARVTLRDAAGVVHAAGTMLVQPGLQRPVWSLTFPLELRLARRWRWFRSHCDLTNQGRLVGSIYEPSLLSAARVLHCDLSVPLDRPSHGLLLYIAIQRLIGR